MFTIKSTVTRAAFIQYRKRRVKLQYLCTYFPINLCPDAVSRSLVLFKKNNPVHVDAWARYAAEAITLPRNCLIVRPLGSQEQSIRPDAVPDTPLDKLCARLASANRCSYAPWLLTKRTRTRPLKGLNRDDRWRTLWDQYRVATPVDTDRIGCILLVDDIITTGTTFRAIIRVLQNAYPKLPVAAFALGRTAVPKMSHETRKEQRYNEWFCEEIPLLREDTSEYQSPQPTPGELEFPDVDEADTFISD